MHFVRLAKTAKNGENARNSNMNACNFAKIIFTDFNFFSLTDWVKNFLNPLKFDRIMVMCLWPRFLAHPVHRPRRRSDNKSVLLYPHKTKYYCL